MPGFLIDTTATILCPHGGQAKIIPKQVRVRIGGQPVATLDGVYPVAPPCPFTIGPKPSPCAQLKWMVPALRVRVAGKQPLVQSSVGLAQSAENAPQGPPVVVKTQVRVRAM